MPDDLAAAIARATASESPYWAFLDVGELDRAADHEVEIRLNLSPAIAVGLDVPGWRVVRVEPTGQIYLRRMQPLTDVAVRQMIVEAITLAHRYAGQFHSWLHAPDLKVTLLA